MFFIKFRFLCAWLLAVTVLTACNGVRQVTATPTPDGSTGVRAVMEEYKQSISQMNAEKAAALFAPDGEIYDTGQLQASGPDAIRDYLKASFAAPSIDSFTSTVDSIFISGSDAAVLGTDDATTSHSTGQGNESKRGYIAERIRQSDGQAQPARLGTEIPPQNRK